MGQDANPMSAGDMKTYQPRVQVVNKSQQECEDFWEKLVREGEQAERALLFGEGSDEAQADQQALEQEAEGQPAEDGAEEAPEPELTFEERYEKLMDVVTNKPTHREILIRTLSHCTTQREFGEVEETIQAYPEFATADQNPYRLITFLIDGGGLDRLEVASDGHVIEADEKEGLTEDEIDDLIDSFHLKATDVGEKLAEDLSPERRLSDMFSMFSDRKPFYTELLEFCREPHKFKDIEKLFKGRDFSGLRTLHPESGLAIKPTVFVDNMEKAGAIVWKKDGWVLTKEGEAYLESIARASMK